MFDFYPTFTVKSFIGHNKSKCNHLIGESTVYISLHFNMLLSLRVEPSVETSHFIVISLHISYHVTDKRWTEQMKLNTLLRCERQ